MAGGAGAGVDESGEASVRFPHRAQLGAGVGGREHEMHVVGHQAISPAGDAVGAAALGEKIAIERVVARLGEQRLAAIAALGHVMRQAGNRDAGKARLGSIISRVYGAGYEFADFVSVPTNAGAWCRFWASKPWRPEA